MRFTCLPTLKSPTPDFPQRPVEISEHDVKEALAHSVCRRTFRFEPVQKEESVHTDQLEAPVERIGNREVGKKGRLPGLLDDPSVGALGRLPVLFAAG